MFNNCPYFSRMNRSVADSVVEKVIEPDGVNSSNNYVSDDLKKINSSKYLNSSKSVDSLVLQTDISKSFNPAKNLNNVVVKATGFGLAANIVTSYFFKDYNWGYVAESAAYSAYFTFDYWHTNRKAGISKQGVSIDVLVLGIASFLLSTGPYRIGKNEIIDYSIKKDIVGFIHDPDMARAFASGVTQIFLLPVWAGGLQLVKKGIDYFDNKLEFKDKLINLSRKINKNAWITKTDKLSKSQEPVIDVELCPINKQKNLPNNNQSNL